MNQTTELKQAVKKADETITSLLDPVPGHPHLDHVFELGVDITKEGLEGLQEQLTIVKNIVLPAQLILFFDDDRGFDYVEQDSTKYIP
jgi:hypothetical protein